VEREKIVCEHHPSRKRETETDQGQGGFVKSKLKAEKIEEKL